MSADARRMEGLRHLHCRRRAGGLIRGSSVNFGWRHNADYPHGRADWTFAVAITFKDIAATTGPSDEASIAKKLFSDQAKFKVEEQRRFELLDAHWDVPLNELTLDSVK